MKKWLILLVLSLAILNINILYAQDNDNVWEKNITSSMILSKGNNDNLQSLAGIGILNDTFNSKLKLGCDYLYGEDENIKEDENLKIYQEYERILLYNIFWLFNSSLEYDLASELDRRILVGPGIGFYIIKDKNTMLSLDSGISYIIEKYNDPYLDEDIMLQIRQRFEQKYNKIIITEELKLLPEIDYLNDYILESKLAIKINIWDKLSIKNSLENTYQSMPINDNKHNNLRLITGVVYEF